MEILAGISGYVVPFLVILTILVFIHELGHYLVARHNGVYVEVFSVGIGPEIFGWTDKKKTRWRVSLIPFGGYVRMFGDQDEASTPDQKALKKMTAAEKSRSLHYKSVWQRIAVSAAGPLANYLLAIVLLTGLYATVGQRYISPKIGTVQEESAAEKAGLQVGDRILEIESTPITQFDDLQKIVSQSADKPLTVIIQRESEDMTIIVTPDLKEVTDVFGETQKVGIMGISPAGIEFVRRNPMYALWYSIKDTASFTGQTLEALGQMIVGKRSADGLAGPLRIAQLSGEVSKAGIPAMIWFMAILSISLGLINFFPVPMLDGGHLLFYFIEAARGKPVSEKVQEYAFRVGFFIIIGLMAFAMWNDIVHLKVFQYLWSWF